MSRSISGAAGTARHEEFSSLRLRAVSRSLAHASSQLRRHRGRSSQLAPVTAALRSSSARLPLFLPCSECNASPVRARHRVTVGDGPNCPSVNSARLVVNAVSAGCQVTRFEQRQARGPRAKRRRQHVHCNRFSATATAEFAASTASDACPCRRASSARPRVARACSSARCVRHHRTKGCVFRGRFVKTAELSQRNTAESARRQCYCLNPQAPCLRATTGFVPASCRVCSGNRAAADSAS